MRLCQPHPHAADALSRQQQPNGALVVCQQPGEARKEPLEAGGAIRGGELAASLAVASYAATNTGSLACGGQA